MGFYVPISSLAAEFDTLPALKTRYYSVPASTAKIYSMARIYLLNGSLQLQLTVFEENPAPNSCIAFACAGGGGQFFMLTLSPLAYSLGMHKSAEPLPMLPPGAAPALPGPQRFSGVDEQGWYWGAKLAVAQDVLAGCGIYGQPGKGFCAALIKHSGDGGGYGSSVQNVPGRPLYACNFMPFTFV